MWYVDNMMISHADPDAVDDVIHSLREKYGEMMHLFVHCSKLHTYIGIMFDFNKEQKVKITMYQHIDNLIEGVPEIYKLVS